jgi:hypothetical protein
MRVRLPPDRRLPAIVAVVSFLRGTGRPPTRSLHCYNKEAPREAGLSPKERRQSDPLRLRRPARKVESFLLRCKNICSVRRSSPKDSPTEAGRSHGEIALWQAMRILYSSRPGIVLSALARAAPKWRPNRPLSMKAVRLILRWPGDLGNDATSRPLRLARGGFSRSRQIQQRPSRQRVGMVADMASDWNGGPLRALARSADSDPPPPTGFAAAPAITRRGLFSWSVQPRLLWHRHGVATLAGDQ